MHCTNSKLANSHAMAGGGLRPAKTQIKHAVACTNEFKRLKGIQRSKRGLANSITLHANWHWCLIKPQSLKCLTQRSRHLKDSGLLRATQASGVSGPSWVTAGGAHGHPKPKRRPGNNGDIGGGGGKTVKKTQVLKVEAPPPPPPHHHRPCPCLCRLCLCPCPCL